MKMALYSLIYHTYRLLSPTNRYYIKHLKRLAARNRNIIQSNTPYLLLDTDPYKSIKPTIRIHSRQYRVRVNVI